MSLLDLELADSYETTESKSMLLDEFYIPVLKTAKKYYRIAGFFSSSALSVASKGIAGLLLNGGSMYLLVSPELSQQDFDIIREHGSLTEDISIFSDFHPEEQPDDNLKLLAWLLDNNRLKIKIAVPIDSENSLFHQKIGIIFDEDNNIISFSGSINESARAWLHNIEEFKVFHSWEPGQVSYLQSDINKFKAYWKNERKGIASVYDLPMSIQKKLIKIKPRDYHDLHVMKQYRRQKEMESFSISLFPHQQEAVFTWEQNNYSLLFEMATGTGKTRTAIGCITQKLKEKESLLVIVSTPQNTLSRQWQIEMKNLGVDFERAELIDGTVTKWRKKLEILLLDLYDKKINNAVIFVTHDTASSAKFIEIIKNNKLSSKILFVGDEVHAVGAPQMKNALLDEYDYRIGLSATPERMFDEAGTTRIRNYFGNRSYEFTIHDALSTINPRTNRPFLNRYEYHPIFVPLTQDEERRYREVSKQIAIVLSDEDHDEKELERLYERRAKIIRNAANKFDVLANLLHNLNPDSIQDTILFVSPQQIEASFSILSSLGIKRAKITENESASKVVNSEGQTERQEIISQFARHDLQVLVGMKCLDEGIDIPNARIAILMASSTNPREFIQRVGRVIRQAENKPVSHIYDFIVCPASDTEASVLLMKEARRANYIAENAINFREVRKQFEERGVDLDAN